MLAHQTDIEEGTNNCGPEEILGNLGHHLDRNILWRRHSGNENVRNGNAAWVWLSRLVSWSFQLRALDEVGSESTSGGGEKGDI